MWCINSPLFTQTFYVQQKLYYKSITIQERLICFNNKCYRLKLVIACRPRFTTCSPRYMANPPTFIWKELYQYSNSIHILKLIPILFFLLKSHPPSCSSCYINHSTFSYTVGPLLGCRSQPPTGYCPYLCPLTLCISQIKHPVCHSCYYLPFLVFFYFIDIYVLLVFMSPSLRLILLVLRQNLAKEFGKNTSQ